MFSLDSRLANDTIELADWPLCSVRLMNDSHYPWLILVPKVASVTELFQLDDAQRLQLDAESTFVARTLMEIFQGDKMNVAALGNVVKQLHIHHVVRFEQDAAWPGPIWGKVDVEAYSDDQLSKIKQQLEPITLKTW